MRLSKGIEGHFRIMGGYKKVIAKEKNLVKASLHHKKNRSLLDGISEDLPALSRAEQITKRVSTIGFDWPNLEGILNKMDEEMGEFKEALAAGNRERVREEVGDLLFVLANIARFLNIHPEEALEKTLKKFISRFKYIEVALQREGRNLLQSNLDEMDALWEKAKRKERS